jgi:hypothetical protein
MKTWDVKNIDEESIHSGMKIIHSRN